MKPLLQTRLFAVVVQLYAIAAIAALSERAGHGFIDRPLAVAVGLALGLGNVLWWTGRR